MHTRQSMILTRFSAKRRRASVMEQLETRNLLAGDVAPPVGGVLGLRSDIDGDGQVQFADFAILADTFGAESLPAENGDINADGSVDFHDFTILSTNYGRSTDIPIARLQLVHNSPYASAAEVDVYLDGGLLGPLDNFSFRHAVPFIDVPAGVDVQIDITAPDAEDNSAPVFSSTVTLNEGETYIAAAGGDPAVSDGPTAFDVFLTDMGRESGATAGNVDLLVFHGSPDAPAVDVIARDVATLVDDISYPEFDDDYVSVPAADYVIDITPADDNDMVVASFEAGLASAADGALLVAASGFLAPAAETDPRFGLLAVFPNGETALLPAEGEQPAEQARIQVIHNSPYAAAHTVDVYVNGALLPALDNFEFQSATPFIDIPAGVDITLDVTAPDAPDNSAPIFSTTVVLDDGETYLAVADGDPAESEGLTAFSIFVKDMGREASATAGNVDLLVFHGSPDAPTVDVVARDVARLVDGISYPEFDSDYVPVPPDEYIIDITLGDTADTVIASFAADLSSAEDAALLVAASGFAAPPAETDPSLGLLAVFANGDTALLPAAVDMALKDV